MHRFIAIITFMFMLTNNSANSQQAPPAMDAHTAVSIYFNLYSIAKLCADNDISFNSDQITSIEGFVRSRLADIKMTKEQEDSIWRDIQTSLATSQVSTGDCAAVMFEMQMLFPADVLAPKIPENPF